MGDLQQIIRSNPLTEGPVQFRLTVPAIKSGHNFVLREPGLKLDPDVHIKMAYVYLRLKFRLKDSAVLVGVNRFSLRSPEGLPKSPLLPSKTSVELPESAKHSDNPWFFQSWPAASPITEGARRSLIAEPFPEERGYALTPASCVKPFCFRFDFESQDE